MNVVLLGLEFSIGNLGCEALSYSFSYLMNKVSVEIENEMEFTAVAFCCPENFQIFDSDKKIEFVKIQYNSFAFWNNLKKLFKKADLIVDFTGGDSFSDIYGVKRFLFATYIKVLAEKSGTPFLLGPQTYGPFKHRMCEKIAARVIKKANWVFARDILSAKYAEEISARKVQLTTDVAFSLPYQKKVLSNNTKIKVGINPSGYLWNGGYSFAKIPLRVNYQEYLKYLIEQLVKSNKFEVYLIPHVGTTGVGGRESDFECICKIKELFPSTVIVDSIRTPIDAKNIISLMDVFVGARMHATIAAFSSGVATIPFSYSRKFEGLYGSLDYKYLIDAYTYDTDQAVKQTITWIDNYEEMKRAVEKSSETVKRSTEQFYNDLKAIVISLDAK